MFLLLARAAASVLEATGVITQEDYDDEDDEDDEADDDDDEADDTADGPHVHAVLDGFLRRHADREARRYGKSLALLVDGGLEQTDVMLRGLHHIGHQSY